jgi:phage terminase small subunit
MENKLTDKQSKFIDEYLIDLNATQAYVRAGYSPKLAHTHASKLLQNATISTEVDKRKKELATNAKLTREDIAESLAKVIEKFLLDGFNTGQALRAIEIYNKMNGFNEPDKVDHTTNGNDINPTQININIRR